MFHIYTDGSAQTNPGKSGWAYLILADDHHTHVHKDHGTWHYSTNQRAELMAIVEALGWVNGVTNEFTKGAPITIYSDSKYAISCLSEWWQKWERNGWQRKDGGKWLPVKNADLIRRGVGYAKRLNVRWQWVKGHSGNQWNEFVDSMANAAAASIHAEEDSGYGQDKTTADVSLFE
jgi:ribonuclease HI